MACCKSYNWSALPQNTKEAAYLYNSQGELVGKETRHDPSVRFKFFILFFVDNAHINRRHKIANMVFKRHPPLKIVLETAI